MKKIFLTVALATTVVMGASAQFRLGGEAGLNLSKMKYKESNNTETSDAKAGLKLGLSAEYSFTDNIQLATGFFFTQKGKKIEEKNEPTVKTTLNYLQIPINAQYRYHLNDDFSIFGFTGFNFGIAVSGKHKAEYKGQKNSEKVDFKEEEKSRLDVSWAIGAGVEYKNIYLKLQEELGLNNLYTGDGSSDYKIRGRNFGISVGYFFLSK